MRKFRKYLAFSIVLFSPVLPLSNGIFSQSVVTAQETSPQEHAMKVVEELQSYFENEALPTKVLTAESPVYLSAATTKVSDTENFNILYYAENEPYEVNNQELNNKTPIAAFQRVVYEDEAAAQEAVNQVIDNQGEEIDLGYGITGYLTAGMGSTYLNWQEGNWSLAIQAPNQEGVSSPDLAKQIVEYLEEIALPAPEVVGQIKLRMNDSLTYEDNVATWQVGNVVYTVSHADPFTLIEMTGSITNPTEQ
ncbi:hypothetical protein [Globicatella sanguinis]